MSGPPSPRTMSPTSTTNLIAAAGSPGCDVSGNPSGGYYVNSPTHSNLSSSGRAATLGRLQGGGGVGGGNGSRKGAGGKIVMGAKEYKSFACLPQVDNI